MSSGTPWFFGVVVIGLDGFELSLVRRLRTSGFRSGLFELPQIAPARLVTGSAIGCGHSRAIAQQHNLLAEQKPLSSTL